MLSKIRDLIQGFYYANIPDLPPHIREQAELRAFLCAPCTNNGSCIHCKCKTPEMFFSPLKKDSDSKWAEFFSLSQWEALKNNFELYDEYFRLLRNTGTDLSSGDSTIEGAVT